MGGISSVVSVECESVTTADSGWGEEFTTAVVDLHIFCMWPFSHRDDTLHYENGKYYGGDLLHNLSMDTAQHFI